MSQIKQWRWGAALIADRVLTLSEIAEKKKEAEENGEESKLFSLQSGAIEESKGAPVIKEICTKSYGIRFYTYSQEKVHNTILKGDKKPVTKSFGPLQISNNPTPTDEVEILILEDDSMEEELNIDECVQIFKPQPVKLSEALAGDAELTIDLSVDGNGTLSFVLTEVDTGRQYKAYPERVDDVKNDMSIQEAASMTLK